VLTDLTGEWEALGTTFKSAGGATEHLDKVKIMLIQVKELGALSSTVFVDTSFFGASSPFGRSLRKIPMRPLRNTIP